jgi:hypothetical protein
LFPKKTKSSELKKLTPKSFDFDPQDEDFSEVFVREIKERLPDADIYDDGDNILISLTGPLPEKLKQGRDDLSGADFDAADIWLQPSTMDEEDVNREINNALSEHGLTMKRKFDGQLEKVSFASRAKKSR